MFPRKGAPFAPSCRVFKGVGGMPGEEEKPALDSMNPKLFQRMFDVEKQHTQSRLEDECRICNTGGHSAMACTRVGYVEL